MLLGLVLVLSVVSEAKVFERCELATLLRHKHRLTLAEVANWVCIAQHSSGFDTEAYGSGLEGGSHGLFQISDVYWCSPPGKGFGCNVACERLRDADLTDDLECMREIYKAHQRISGDGYNAWTAYQQFCQNRAQTYIEDCLPQAASAATNTFQDFLQVAAAFKRHAQTGHTSSSSSTTHLRNALPKDSSETVKRRGKVYSRCELAQELHYVHNLPMEEIPTWVCIAQHESQFDSAAVGRLNADGSADHGLFQISDLYWCSTDHRGSGKACGLPCSKLLDDDISDDLRCIRQIHREHTAISGDGFTAWTVYNRDCRNQQYEHVSACFEQDGPSKYRNVSSVNSAAHDTRFSSIGNQIHTPTLEQPAGKVYGRCELARELHSVHGFSMQDTATWVCIAQHESNYDTAAVGRLNADGSADYGLFQISDLFWCSRDERKGGKACGLSCNRLLDSDIADDVGCIRTIHAEHTRISGDGFTAWTVYEPYCRNQRSHHIKECFGGSDAKGAPKGRPNDLLTKSRTAIARGKVYKRCELAQELYFEHKMPMHEIPTWVCIAQHESRLDTAAVGRLNADGSADHGLFQISDLYWCSHSAGGGKGCNLACSQLLDADIADDVRCLKTIHEEHTRIAGDGFTAWAVYKPHCRHQRMEQISACFDSKVMVEAVRATNPGGRSAFNTIADGGKSNLLADAPQSHMNRNPFLQAYLSRETANASAIHHHDPKFLAKTLPHHVRLGDWSFSANRIIGDTKFESRQTTADASAQVPSIQKLNSNPILLNEAQIADRQGPSKTRTSQSQHISVENQNPFLPKINQLSRDLSVASSTLAPKAAGVPSSYPPKSPLKQPMQSTKTYIQSESFRSTPKPNTGTTSTWRSTKPSPTTTMRTTNSKLTEKLPVASTWSWQYSAKVPATSPPLAATKGQTTLPATKRPSTAATWWPTPRKTTATKTPKTLPSTTANKAAATNWRVEEATRTTTKMKAKTSPATRVHQPATTSKPTTRTTTTPRMWKTTTEPMKGSPATRRPTTTKATRTTSTTRKPTTTPSRARPTKSLSTKSTMRTTRKDTTRTTTTKTTLQGS